MEAKSLSDQAVRALLRREREALVGRLLPGLVHNLSGAIQMIRLPLDMVGLLLSQANQQAAGERLESVNQGLERLTHELEVLGTKCLQSDSAKDDVFDLEQLARQQLEFWRADLFFKHDVKVSLLLEGGGPIARGSWLDTCLAFNSLIANSLEAVRATDDPTITVSAWKNGAKAGLMVSDSGPGPDEQYRDRMFEAFVSSKGEEHDGLGLFLSRYAMRAHQGDVTWQAGPAGGFLLALPAV